MSANSMFESIVTAISVAFALSPGMLVSRYLFPREDAWWHFGVGGSVGIAIVGYIALALSYLPLGVTPLSFAVLVLGLDILSLVLLLRDWSKAREAIARFRNHSWKNQLLSVFTLTLVLVTLTWVQPLGKLHKESFTEFYILVEDPKFAIWRQEISPSTRAPLRFDVVSHETQIATYTVNVVTEGQIVEAIDLGNIEPNKKAHRLITLPPPIRNIQRYDLILYKDGSTEPYRTLHFWLRTTFDTK